MTAELGVSQGLLRPEQSERQEARAGRGQPGHIYHCRTHAWLVIRVHLQLFPDWGPAHSNTKLTQMHHKPKRMRGLRP